MKYYTNPQTRIRKLGPTHSIRVESMGRVLAVLSGYPSLEAATEDAKRIAIELNEGIKTLEEVKANRLRPTTHRGLTQLEWAKYLGIHRNSIYQGAKYQGITWQTWIENKLPPAKRLSNGSTEAFHLP